MNDQDRSLTYALSLASFLGLAVFPCHTIGDDGACSCGHIPDGAGGCSCGIPVHKGTCESPGKHPATARGFKDASNEEAQVIALWRGAPNESNIGIATGNGIIVIDCDIKPGIDGRASLADLEAKHGSLPDTLTAKTGSGGLHLYFRTSGATINNSASKIGPGIDVRGDGGYVISPPSKHKSGGVYSWIDTLVPIADAPEWLLDAAKRRPAPRVTQATVVDITSAPSAKPEDSGNRRYALGALRGVCDDLRATPKGQRHTEVFNKAFKMGGFVGSAALAASEVESELLSATRSAGWDKERENNTITAIRDGIRAGQTKPLEAPIRIVNQSHAQPSAAAYAEVHATAGDDERSAIQGETPSNVIPIGSAKKADTLDVSLPNDVRREDALIATLLFREGAYDECSGTAKKEYFHRVSNGAIFDTISILAEAGSTYTARDVANAWRSKGEAGHDSELERLSDDRLLLSANAIKQEAEIIRDLYRQREMIRVCEEVARTGRKRTPNIQRYLDVSLYEVEQAAEPPTVEDMGTAAELASGFIDRLHAAIDRNGAMRGISSCLRQVDAALGGIIKQNQIILAGRPSMGKTAAACQIGMNVSYQPDDDGVYRNGTLIFSLETPKEKLADRMLFNLSGMSGNDADTGKLSKRNADNILKRCNAADRDYYMTHPAELKAAADEEVKMRGNAAAVAFAAMPIFIHHKPGLTVTEMWRMVRFVRAKWRKQGIRLALVIVDYLQLMDGTSLVGRNASREQEVGKIAEKTRVMAQKEDIPLLMLAQLNRAVEKQKDKRPMLSDLRESGQIEMHADTIIFVHREEQYLREETPEEWRGLAEFIIAKNKDGPTRTAWVGYQGQTTRFTDTPKSDARAYQD